MKRLSPLFAVLMVIAGTQLSPAFEEGKAFPALEFTDADSGELKTLADYRGKKTVLHIYASW